MTKVGYPPPTSCFLECHLAIFRIWRAKLLCVHFRSSWSTRTCNTASATSERVPARRWIAGRCNLSCPPAAAPAFVVFPHDWAAKKCLSRIAVLLVLRLLPSKLLTLPNASRFSVQSSSPLLVPCPVVAQYLFAHIGQLTGMYRYSTTSCARQVSQQLLCRCVLSACLPERLPTRLGFICGCPRRCSFSSRVCSACACPDSLPSSKT